MLHEQHWKASNEHVDRKVAANLCTPAPKNDNVMLTVIQWKHGSTTCLLVSIKDFEANNNDILYICDGATPATVKNNYNHYV